MTGPVRRRRDTATTRLGLITSTLVAVVLAVLVAAAANCTEVPAATDTVPETPSAAGAEAAPSPAEVVVPLRIRPLPEGVRRVSMERDQEGERSFLVERVDGTSERLSPEQFAALLDPGEQSKSLLYKLLNITSPIGFMWVTIGFLGQLTFTGRMLLQWLVSEREKRSVVPVGFWWMSLIGASMLMLYFIWRKDIIGVLGQSAGWTIYSRNLWLIYRERKQQEEDSG